MTAPPWRCPRGARPIRDPEGVTPWLRAVVDSDGLTIESLEAWFREGLAFERPVQQIRRTARPHRTLGIATGARLLDRWVVFHGARSGRLRMVAHVEVAVERAGERLVSGLERGDSPLGELVRRMAPDAWREPLGAGVVDRVPRDAVVDEPGPWILRRYRIVNARGVLAAVSEYFPCEEGGEARARAS